MIIFETKELFREILKERVGAGSVPKFDSSKLRRELFKFSYLFDNFAVNKKADAAEALMFLLGALHSD